MACVGQCLGMATGPVCHLKLQKDALVSLFPRKSLALRTLLPPLLHLQQGTGDNNTCKGVISCCSSLSTRNRPQIVRGVMAMASQEGGISTLVVQEVEFFWKGQGSEVLLSGDFLNWESKVPMEKGPNGWFVVKQKLAPGKYTFKFIVDGQWQHSPDYPLVSDNANGFNNEVLVPEEPSSTEAAGKQTATNALGSETAPQSRTAETPAAAGKKVAKTVATTATASPTRTAETPAAAGKKVAKTVATTATASPTTDAASARPKPVPAAGATKVAKAAAVVKSLQSTVVEDVIPELSTFLKKQDGISDVELTFVDNELQGCFAKNGVPYSFWVYFPDGKLEGTRGFSISSHGSTPSTIEPFLIDEKKITGDLVVFWVSKRLFAQKLLSTN
ncbi:unnamed protein product [Sphagnum compactum]